MPVPTYIMLAPFELKEGIDEDALLAASESFQSSFVKLQPGIVRRHLLRVSDGRYADLVFFADKEAAERVLVAEKESTACLDYFRIMKAPDPALPDMGVLSFQQLTSYE